MDHVELERIQERMNPDWEHAFNRFESVMASGTEVIRLQLVTKVTHLSKQAPEYVLARTIPILVKVLEEDPLGNSRSIQEAAAYGLYRIACRGDEGLAVEIGQSGAIPSLVRLLPHSDNSFRRALIKSLWSFVTFGRENRVIVARNGGLEAIIDLLNSGTDGSRRYLLEILSALTLLRSVRITLVRISGLRFLVEAASCGNMVSRERACQSIGLLGVKKQARRSLVELGVIPVLVQLFCDGDNVTKLVASNSLGIVSSHFDHIRPGAEAGAIPLYVELLEGPNAAGKEIAEDALFILAVDVSNAVVIAGHLVRVLREGDDETRASAANVMWDLAGLEHSVTVFQDSGAIPVLVDLLSNGNVEIVEKVSGVIAGLSYEAANRAQLADAGAIPVLIELLCHFYEELSDNAAEALVCFSEDPLLHDKVTEAFEVPAFLDMQDRLLRSRGI